MLLTNSVRISNRCNGSATRWNSTNEIVCILIIAFQLSAYNALRSGLNISDHDLLMLINVQCNSCAVRLIITNKI